MIHIDPALYHGRPASGREAVEELKGYAFVHGVILDICEYGTSEKYVSG